jgi:hypothetical protein
MALTPRDKIVAAYNKEVTGLVKIIEKLHASDMDVERLRNKLRIANGADPEFVIKESGPYIFKYQAPIIAGRDVFFIDPTGVDPSKLSTEDAAVITQLKADFATVKPEDMMILTKIRKSYTSMIPEEKTDIKARVTRLLTNYIQYLLICKQT